MIDKLTAISNSSLNIAYGCGASWCTAYAQLWTTGYLLLFIEMRTRPGNRTSPLDGASDVFRCFGNCCTGVSCAQAAMPLKRPTNFSEKKTDFRTNWLTPQVVIMQKDVRVQGALPLTLWLGALPLDPTSASDLRYRLALYAHDVIPTKLSIVVNPPANCCDTSHRQTGWARSRCATIGLTPSDKFSV